MQAWASDKAQCDTFSRCCDLVLGVLGINPAWTKCNDQRIGVYTNPLYVYMQYGG